MDQPIKVEAHAIIDYGFAAATLGIPLVLGLSGAARVIPMTWGAGQGLLNAVTDQPYAPARILSFRGHGQVEAVALPALMLTIALMRPFGQPRTRPFFATLLTALAANYALTDYDARPRR